MEERIKRLIQEMKEIAEEIEGGDYWCAIPKGITNQLYDECLRMGDIAFCLKEE